MTKNDDGTVKAVVTTSTTENGETVTKEEIFEGTKEEVEKKIEAFKGTDKNIKVRIKKEVKEEK